MGNEKDEEGSAAMNSSLGVVKGAIMKAASGQKSTECKLVKLLHPALGFGPPDRLQPVPIWWFCIPEAPMKFCAAGIPDHLKLAETASNIPVSGRKGPPPPANSALGGTGRGSGTPANSAQQGGEGVSAASATSMPGGTVRGSGPPDNRAQGARGVVPTASAASTPGVRVSGAALNSQGGRGGAPWAKGPK